jgi:hypothetical protein
MTILASADRTLLWQTIQTGESNLGQAIGPNKVDLLAALGAMDDWLEANSSSLNLAIPQPARGQLTTRQKALLLGLIAARRAALA